jgi:hypothetical protein
MNKIQNSMDLQQSKNHLLKDVISLQEINSLLTNIKPLRSTYSATIQSIESGTFIILIGDVPLSAKKATSCLIEPELHDKVSVYFDEFNLYITNILDRYEDSNLKIIAKNGLDISTSNGNLNFSSDADIHINSKNTLYTFAKNANVVISEVNFLADIVSITSKTLNLIVTTYKGIIDSFNMQNKSVIHYTDGHEEHSCDSSRKIVKNSDIKQVKNSILMAEDQVKIDAEQINMG